MLHLIFVKISGSLHVYTCSPFFKKLQPAGGLKTVDLKFKLKQPLDVCRRVFWEDTMTFIEEHNKKYDRGESTFYLGENEFSDMVHVVYVNLISQYSVFWLHI